MKRTVDVAIIGGGTGGLGAWRELTKLGKSCLMIDPGPFGTTCARVGCMPSKLLIASANTAHEAREAGRFGVRVSDVTVDGKAVMARLREKRNKFVGGMLKISASAEAAEELLVERAQITGPNTIQAGDVEIEFKGLVIATGSSPFTPPPFRDLGDVLMTNEQIFELEDLPASVLVIGIGVVGLELGQALKRLGVRTTLLGMGGFIGPISDPVILAKATEVFSDELDLHPDYTLKSIERVEGGVRIQFVDSAGVTRDEQFERVLMAAGRRPNLNNLGLEKIGISPDKTGNYSIDPHTLQLGDARAFVAGDANTFHPLLHEASDDGRRAGENALNFPEFKKEGRRTAIGIVFSEPQIGLVGRNFAQLEPGKAAAGVYDFAGQGRAKMRDVNVGMMRIYGNLEDRRLIGAELFGPEVEHLSHLLAWSIQAGLTVDQAIAMPFYHPTLEEGVRSALRSLEAALNRGQAIK